MWLEERWRLVVTHRYHGVKPPIPGGTRFPSLQHWGFLLLHLKSKPGPSSQQSSPLCPPPWLSRTAQNHGRRYTQLLISAHHVLIYVCVIFNMLQTSKHEPMQMRWRGQYHKLNNSLSAPSLAADEHELYAETNTENISWKTFVFLTGASPDIRPPCLEIYFKAI